MRSLIQFGLVRPSLYRSCSRDVRIGLAASPSRAQSTSTPTGARRRWPAYLVTIATGFGIGSAYRVFFGVGSDGVNPETFTPFSLTGRESVSPTSSIFTLTPASSRTNENDHPYAQLWKQGVWSVEFKQPQLQIARSYTPLPPSLIPSSPSGDGDHEQTLRFLIRREKKGEVSNYLHRIGLGTSIDVRGPKLEFTLPSTTDDVVFIAGGTGIAPALQVARALFSRSTTENGSLPRLHILWANRRREDVVGGVSDTKSPPKKASWIPWRSPPSKEDPEASAADSNRSYLVQELEELKKGHPKQVKVDYFVDEEGTYVGPDNVSAALASKESAVDVAAATSKRKLILVSGPEGFINALAGPKLWEGGREVQGPLAGLLSSLPISDWRVWKL
ncbi:cytochrome c mitochondrial import factor [Xylona heveae TC161]|uniref:Cytochrome c mitochondrial import factor n=1 Tax=Xylona heveae (strain CBS 132557 / TC161) TaxID=1328760 RepID=A0A165FV78_XYLHT|nr:cytochrome c mitochondrial import factor [Xylona heveae TC161]KZF21419.1 cytochrome c mitochondrial import factor [Xylona heveae TC161]